MEFKDRHGKSIEIDNVKTDVVLSETLTGEKITKICVYRFMDLCREVGYDLVGHAWNDMTIFSKKAVVKELIVYLVSVKDSVIMDGETLAYTSFKRNIEKLHEESIYSCKYIARKFHKYCIHYLHEDFYF